MSIYKFSRRHALIAAGTSAGLLASAPANAEEITDPVNAEPAGPTLVEEFLAQERFIIAHRGAGDVNPEHTAYAYQQSILKGARAVEISVRSTIDGEVVCIHDNTLRRTTTEKEGSVSTVTLAELKQVMVDTRDFLGSGTPLQNISTLDEALDVIATTPRGGSYGSVGPDVIYFIEAKDSASQRKVMEAMQKRGLVDQAVIKMYRNGWGEFDPEESFARYAKEAGFITWCYFNASDPLEGIAAMVNSPYVDMVGLPFFENVKGRNWASMSDEQISTIVAMGKPVIVWEVHRRSVMEHMASLGVRGFMAPDPYWLSGGGTPANLMLTSGRRQHGMLPAGQQVAANMPVWENGALVHRQTYDDSIMLGPLAHLAESNPSYVVNFKLKWEGSLPVTTWQFGYLAFGRSTDAPFGLGTKHVITDNNGCYVLAVRPHADILDENGKYFKGDVIQLLRIDNGSNRPIPVKTMVPKVPFAADQEIPCKIIVRPESIVIEVAGTRSEPIADTTYRGQYMHFGRYHGNDYGGGLALSDVVAYRID